MVPHGIDFGPTMPYLPMQGIENKKSFELNEEEINKLREEVGKYTTESDLVRPPPLQFFPRRR